VELLRSRFDVDVDFDSELAEKIAEIGRASCRERV
jgi:hypothetical protein